MNDGQPNKMFFSNFDMNNLSMQQIQSYDMFNINQRLSSPNTAAQQQIQSNDDDDNDSKPHVPKCIDKTKVLLPPDFEPSSYSIICGNKRKFFNSPGNARLRVLVESFIPQFSKADGKLEKGAVVTKVMDMVREACPVGAFVAYEKGRWWQVSERTSREKVGSLFRDFLSDKYKSSAQNKIARRKTKRAEKRQQRKMSVASETTSIPAPENVASLLQATTAFVIEDPLDDSSVSSASCSFYDIDDLRPVQLEEL